MEERGVYMVAYDPYFKDNSDTNPSSTFRVYRNGKRVNDGKMENPNGDLTLVAQYCYRNELMQSGETDTGHIEPGADSTAGTGGEEAT